MNYTPSEIEYLRAKGAPVLNDQVEPESFFYWQAYHHLRQSRPVALGDGPIPFSEITAYCEWSGITCPVQKSILAKVIIALGDVELEHGRTEAQH